MPRHDPSSEADIWRAMLVDEKTDASWDEYLRERSRADTGDDPTADQPAVTDGGESACECLHVRAGAAVDPCYEESPRGNLCSLAAGHDGPHKACSIHEHGIEEWTAI